MKLVSCIIRPEKLDAVVNALDKQHIVGMTLSDVRGFGRQKGQVEHYRGGEYTIRFIPKVKVDLVVQDQDVAKVMTSISETARTGNVGDGKVFVLEVPDALRIRTGERGTSAL
ncbi:MAG TPA: P-II family nitrogen regulator [Elusimicrobiota bacterium]|nr:P-II family nitrogen regulator [Elusimicrobiota bacterium]